MEIVKQDYSAGQPLPPTGKGGLTAKQAQERLAAEGPNQLKGKKKVSALKLFTDQFKDFLVMILLVSTAASVFMGEITEAIAIAIIVLANAVMGFAQEYKTEKTIEALKNMSAPTAKVYRDGQLTELDTTGLVRGDLILVEAGDRVPADAVLLESVCMQADEAILTGESVPASKLEDPSASETNEPNKPNILYMGTSITKGHGKARVIATGMNTQMGKIADMLDEIEEQPTPLQKRLDELGKYIAVGCLAIAAIIMIAGLLRGEPLIQMIITGVSLAVAAVPEGLAAIVTIALALAVKRMVRRKALIRKLHAVETLGCASVICSDKTGTLTENKMTVKQIFTLDDRLEVEGNGYQKAGSFLLAGERVNVNLMPAVKSLLEVAVVCNNAQLTGPTNQDLRDRTRNRSKGSWGAVGEPTEIALLIAGAKAGMTTDLLADEYTKVDEIPFDSTRKCMSVIVKNRSGRRFIFTKGAYDVLIKKCGYIHTHSGTAKLGEHHIRQIDHANEEMAAGGMRVLGVAMRELTGGDAKESDLVFLGLLGMIDPPRKQAKKAVQTCHRAGVKTVMITGDHKLTACAVAKQIGIFREGNLCMTGAEIDRMSDDEFAKIVNKVTVFARVSPSHKLKIVRALKRRGHIVAMTGDGVNDAPAIKEADIGVSMGITGSDVTKQAADVILMDDNFATLVAAIEEGRVIYSNIRKFIRYLLSCNIGEVMTMFAGMIMGMPVVLLPMQILLINLVTDGLPAIALGLEPAEDNTMKRKPRRADESVFSGGLVHTIVFRGVLIGFTTLAVFILIFRMSLSVDAARTGAFLTLVLTQLIHVFECKSETKSIFTIPYFNNIKLILAVLFSACVTFAGIYFAPLNAVLRTVPLTQPQLLIAVGLSLLVPVINAVFLALKRRRPLGEQR